MLVSNSSFSPQTLFLLKSEFETAGIGFIIVDQYLLLKILDSENINLKNDPLQKNLELYYEYQVSSTRVESKNAYEIFFAYRNLTNEEQLITQKLLTDNNWSTDETKRKFLIGADGSYINKFLIVRDFADGIDDLIFSVENNSVCEKQIKIEGAGVRPIFEAPFFGSNHKKCENFFIYRFKHTTKFDLCCIWGEAGIGKTRVFNEIYKKLNGQNLDFFSVAIRNNNKFLTDIEKFLKSKNYLNNSNKYKTLKDTTFWGDRDLKVGDNFVSIIQEYIEKADKLIAVFSPSYFSSTFCQAEISAMLSKGKNNIIPVKISEAQPIGVLSNILYVDLYNVNEDKAKERLLKAVKADKKALSGKSEFPGIKNSEKMYAIETKFPGTMPINNLHFNKEKSVFGGDEKVNAIRQAFNSNNTVSSTLTLSGLGGTGKTIIAQKYIYQFGYLYGLIWWINADNTDSILKAYYEFANENNLINDDGNEISSDKVINIVKKWMLETNNWLFVFDGVVDFDTIQSFIPEKHKGNVLIISRDSLWKNSDVNTITIDVFSTETAIKFLRLHGVSGKEEDLITLSSSLGNIPLNLKMAAKYIVENNLTVISFLEKYNDFEVNDVDSANSFINIASVYKEQGDFQNALKYYYKSLELLENEQNSNYITVYNSIASVYHEMSNYDKAEEIYRKILDIITMGLDNYSVSIDAFDIGTTYNNLAAILREKHKYVEAIQLYNKALVVFKEVFNNEHTYIATTLNNLAFVYYDLGEYANALECYYQVLSIREKILGLNHPDTAKTYTNIADIYDIQNDYEKSILLYENALNIYNNGYL